MSLLDRLRGKEKPSKVERPAGIGPVLATHLSAEFANLLDASSQHLAMITQLSADKWRFGQHKTWTLKQEEGFLRFTFADGMVAECRAQAIGSYSQNDSTWFWAWGNESINASLKQAAEFVQHYGQEQNFPLLTTPEWQATIDDAWAMTAISALLCNQAGAYCGKMGSLSMFFVFEYPTLKQPE